MIIRVETPEDLTAISSLIERPFGRADEARLVDDLRCDGDVSLSLVATEGSLIIGHVLLSRMTAPFPRLVSRLWRFTKIIGAGVLLLP